MHTVKLYDGTTTITLTSGSYTVNNYDMATANINVQEVQSELIRNRFKKAVYSPITDRLRITIIGSSPADAQAKYQAIESMLQFALRSINIPSAQRLYLKVQLSSDSDEWVSDVLYGTIEPSEDMWVGIPQSVIEANITIVRDILRGPTTQLSLSNSHGSGTSVTVYNHEDSSHKNSATITTTIEGTLPSPVKLRLKNSYGSAVTFKTINFGINTHSTPSTFDHILESDESLFGSTVSDSSCSNGSKKTATVTESSTILYKFAWLLDKDFLAKTKGESFIMLARFVGSPPNNVLLAPQVGTYDSPLFFPTWTGNEVLASDYEEIINLGSVSLPGPTYIAGTNYSYGVAIGARGIAAGTPTLTLDYVMLIPSDSWAKMRQSSSLLMANNEYVVLDDIEQEYVYQKGSPNYEKLPVFSKRGNQLNVWPDRTNKIMVNWESTSAATIDWTAVLEAWYQPRRLTL